MNPYLLLFTIGPVQSFIAQARKTQDLYAGSKLLSDLIGEAIKQLPNNSKLIFPDKASISNPNRFIAKISSDDIMVTGNQIKLHLEEYFLNLSKNSISIEFNLKDIKPEIEKQIRTFLQIFWVAIPLTNYEQDFLKIEHLLGSVKNFRDFKQLPEQGRKCSLCGERNVIVYRKLTKEEQKSKFPKDALEIKNFAYLFNSGEGLCVICFTKRMYNILNKRSFESTADVAIANSISKIKEENLKLYDQYKSFFKDQTFDGQLFFEENLNVKYFEKHELGDVAISNLSNIKNSNKEIKRYLKSIHLSFSSYYAILAFDGDKMGEHLSGIFLADKSKLEEFHYKLSESLGHFAKESKKYLDLNFGQTIYAGGDDFLGFVNLSNLFSVLENIHSLFEEYVNKPLLNYFQNNKKMSFSAGIAIAHYKTPLSETLNWASKMEKDAKTKGDRDAYSIAVLKHSGEISSFTIKWNINELITVSFLKDLSNVLRKGIFSTTFINNLHIEFYKLIDPEKKSFIDDKIIRVEIKRLLSRSFIPTEANNREYPEDKKEREIESLTEKLMIIYRETSLDNFFNLLHSIDFMQRKVD